MTFSPVPVSPEGSPEYENTVNSMADRIVKTYLAATERGDINSRLGERFYSRDAHGAARALAAGWNPDEGAGKALRSLASPGERGEPEGPTMPVNTNTPYRQEFEHRVRRAAGVMARLSPQTDWDLNVKQAHEIFQGLPDETVSNLMHDKRDTSQPVDKKTGKHPRVTVMGGNGEVSSLNRQPSHAILHARAIARGEIEPEDDIATDEAHRVKIGSFYHNIVNPDTSPHTTIDFRAHDIATGEMHATGMNRHISRTALRPGSKGHEQKQRYTMLEEAHRRATSIINDKHADRRLQKQPLQPKQVQAVTWWGEKHHEDELGLSNKNGVGKGREGRTPLGQ